MKNYKVFAINPGSTSTKIAMFEKRKFFPEISAMMQKN